MTEKYINAAIAAKENGLFLKIVTSVKSFSNYNSFFNIYDESDETCRRIAIITKDDKVEEVYDENPYEEITENIVVDGNVWLKDYSLLMPPEKINLNELKINEKVFKEFIAN